MRLTGVEFERAFAGLVLEGGPILAAVSGGPDSIALMHALAAWSGAAGRPAVVVATVDHGLRPSSAPEAEAVGAAAAALGLPHRILAWSDGPSRPASQATARTARYRLLLAHAREVGAGRLATAHTLDDQAETVLMRLAAGSGPAGLAGMSPATCRDGIVHLRPFLDIPKARLVATCRAEGWRFVEDPSNADPRFARSRWRRLLPELASEGLDTHRLARLAARMRRAELALERMTDAAEARAGVAEAGDGIRLDACALAAEPTEIALRLLARALSRRGDAAPLRLERLESCLTALLAARAAGRSVRRTLGGKVLTLDREGSLTIAPEGRRSRGSTLGHDW